MPVDHGRVSIDESLPQHRQRQGLYQVSSQDSKIAMSPPLAAQASDRFNIRLLFRRNREHGFGRALGYSQHCRRRDDAGDTRGEESR